MIATETRATRAIAVVDYRAAAKIHLGHYMPFAGVKYYGVFDERDIAEGRHRIGAVGWRLAPPPDKAAPEAAGRRELVAA